MNALYDLKDMLVEQLVDYGTKGELSSSVLEKVDILAHAAKNLDKVIESCEEDEETEYSNRRSRHGYSRNSFDGRVSMRRHSRRRSRSGYSRNGDFADQLYSMMEEAPDERTREELERLASKMETAQ